MSAGIESKTKKQKSKSRKTQKYVTIMLAALTTIIWAIFLIAKYFITGVNFSELLDNIMGNVLGILPPIIIFNFAYEYFTRDYVSSEMSEQITETLMGDRETIKLFSEKAKKDFIGATLSTLVAEEEFDMVYGVIEPYLNSRYGIKKNFRYTITLKEYTANRFFPPDKYIKINEMLTFKKCFVGSNRLPASFSIGFFSDDKKLDKELRGQSYIFRESFKVDSEDIEKLKCLSPDEQRDFVSKFMELRLLVGKREAAIRDVYIDNYGIDVCFESSHNTEATELDIQISFSMPQLTSHREFLVSITEPTYSPTIQLYFPDAFNVTMFPFLNDKDETLIQNAMPISGLCDINLQEEWVYPIGGVVFLIDKN